MKQHVASIAKGMDIFMLPGARRIEMRIGKKSLRFDVSALPKLIDGLQRAETLGTPKTARERPCSVRAEGQAVQVFVDGACWPNDGTGTGGWGALIHDGPVTRELSGGAAETTNNRMELQAAIEALATLPAGSTVCITSDSTYVVRGASEWMHRWKAKGWVKGDGTPRLNSDLWRRLDEQAARHDVTWRWVRGHNGNPGNERADELARQGMHDESEMLADLEMMRRARTY